MGEESSEKSYTLNVKKGKKVNRKKKKKKVFLSLQASRRFEINICTHTENQGLNPKETQLH